MDGGLRHALGEPDTFRLRYRKALIDCVGEAIRQVGRGNAIDAGEVLSHLADDLVPENDREHFLKIAKEEIAALHEGNFARYRLRPGEFKDWQNRKTSWPPTSDISQDFRPADIWRFWMNISSN
jgi:hypothetical protein